MATTAKPVRKRIDSRDWTQYNAWQSDEVALACARLGELVASNTIHDWAPRRGRPRIERRVIVLCLLVKAYFNVSYRRVHGLLVLLQPAIGLERVPHYNTIAKYGLEPGLTGTLKRLLDETARPFWATEKTLTIDSTGLLLQGSESWRGDHTDEDRRDYAKIHIFSGAQRRATLGVRTTRGLWHDAPQLEPLVEEIPEDAVAENLVGDGAYWTRACVPTSSPTRTPDASPRPATPSNA